jgi:ABC-2 type transport system ATP-binding protein
MSATTQSATHAIAARSVSKIYRTALETKVALHDLSLFVVPSSFTALVGPNGAGKTTAIKTVATLIRPTTGSVCIFGNDSSTFGTRVRKEIGYVGQETSTDTYASVTENILHHGAMYGLATKTSVTRAEELLNTFGLDKQAEMEVRRLSGGQRRRLDIAMALLHQPRLLILDEPTANLDPDARRRVWETLRRIRQRQELTILFSTHNLEEADRNADDIFFIDKGRCVTNGSPAQLKDSLGGESLVMEFIDTENAMRAGLVLSERKGGAEAVLAGSSVIVPCDGAREIHALLELLAHQSLVPESVSLSRPSLEDVYIRLTGATFESADLEGQQAQITRQKGNWQW